MHSRGSNFSKLERGELWTGAFLFSLRGGTKKIELHLLTNRLYSFSSFTRTHTHTHTTTTKQDPEIQIRKVVFDLLLDLSAFQRRGDFVQELHCSDI